MAMGFFLAQTDWVMHMAGHRSAFADVRWDQLLQTFLMALFSGDIPSAWNETHNKHHAKTNVYLQDPDIGGGLIFFWHELVKNESLSRHLVPFGDLVCRGLLCVQDVTTYFFYSIFVIRRNMLAPFYAFASTRDAFGGWNGRAAKRNPEGPGVVQNHPFHLEVVCACFHWVIVYWIYISLFRRHGLSVGTFFLNFIVTKLIQGLYLGIVFTANHNHLEVDMKHIDNLDRGNAETPEEGTSSITSPPAAASARSKIVKETNWVEMQCVGTLNYSEDWVTCIMTGFLNFQIEHHLVPNMPQCNYRYIAKDVRDMCETYHLPYQCEPFHVAIMHNHMLLHKVAKKARVDYWGW
eukprot:CAMPEP_0169210774 /NCGR_PEP_ID=MMETSP1016-20121227/15397_1 /TAXON_ID=342587 /ORGANISM="Karlodinium micrum, Strain CCMP2283" /LENGTH=349 /DNA_ID=CAMNT_0009288343 /DNA_START=1 /DNA_END=1050 /DNA_ORIENTATION=-